MDQLENHFKAKVEVTDSSIKYCEGDLLETKAVINTSFIELGEIKRNLAEQKCLLRKWQDLLDKADFCKKYVNALKAETEGIAANLPKRLTKQQHVHKDPVREKGDPGSGGHQQKSTNSGEKKSSQANNGEKTFPLPPTVPYLTVDQFNSVPKYMKGRWNYDQINGCIDELNKSFEDRYTFLGKGFNPKASISEKKRFKEMKTQETRETKGFYFVVAEDMRNAKTLKSEAARRSFFTILRHFQLVKEIRGTAGSQMRYAINKM